MGALRRAGQWLGLIEEDEDRPYERGYDSRGYGDDFEDEVDEVPAPVRQRSPEPVREPVRMERGADRTAVRQLARQSSNYPTRDNLALAPQVQLRERAVDADDRGGEDERRYQITTLHPTTYNEARAIGEHFRDGVPVIMNLTELADADARRLVDFAAGLAFGLRGTMDRVTNRVFLLSPANVQVTAEDKARIAEGGFFNQS